DIAVLQANGHRKVTEPAGHGLALGIGGESGSDEDGKDRSLQLNLHGSPPFGQLTWKSPGQCTLVGDSPGTNIRAARTIRYYTLLNPSAADLFSFMCKSVTGTNCGAEGCEDRCFAAQSGACHRFSRPASALMRCRSCNIFDAVGSNQ